MLFACTGIRHFRWNEIVGPKSNEYPTIKSAASRRRKLPDLQKIGICFHIARQDERLSVCDAIHKAEGSRYDIHFPVADQDVAIASESFNAFILVSYSWSALRNPPWQMTRSSTG